MKQLAAIAILACACGAPQHRAPAPDGCPSAGQVALATWNPRTVVGSPPYKGMPKEGVWLVRLGFRAEDAVDAPAPGPVAAYQIAKLGIGPLPDTVWLLRAGLAPCETKVTGYVSGLVDEGPISLRISAVLAGCAAPPEDEQWSLGWISAASAAPKGCELKLPAHVGDRAGTTTDGAFTIPAASEASALPAVWNDMLDLPCDGCERLWSIDAIAGAPTINAVTVSDVAPGSTEECGLDYHDQYGFYASMADGQVVALQLGEGYDLAGALVDPRGTRVVLATNADHWAAHDVGADGRLAASHVVRYYAANEEDGMWHSMTPYCGP